MTSPPSLDDARDLLAGADHLVGAALDRAREMTDGGKRIDDHQVLAERVAYAATEARAARELIEFTASAQAAGAHSEFLELTCAASVADLVTSLRDRLAQCVDDLGLGEAVLEAAFPAERRERLRRVGNESVYRTLGKNFCATRGPNEMPLDVITEQVRNAVRECAHNEDAPEADHLHPTDANIPEPFNTNMA
jgi:hypothetical protein